MLTKFVQHKKETQNEFFDTCVFAYNTSRHESTTFTPFELMFGRRAHLPVDVDCATKKETANELLEKWQQVRSDIDQDALTSRRQQNVETAKMKIKEEQTQQKHYYDLRHYQPDMYIAGALVLMKDLTRKKRKGGKLDLKWLGPFMIKKKSW